VETTVISALLELSDSTDRWQHLQLLRRGRLPAQPWLEQIEQGEICATADVLAALLGQLNRAGVERLLRGPVGRDPAALLEAARRELPSMASALEVQQAWVEPLLAQPPTAPWLELIGLFRDPRGAARLRMALEAADPADPAQANAQRLLPLLGQQRQPQDAALLLELALAPVPLAWRRAALEGLAVGLSAWPLQPLADGLQQLSLDLDPGLAAQAVDLLARLPDGQRQLRQLQGKTLAPSVVDRWRRRLQRAPLVLVVHGRQAGVIPEVLQQLAADLEQSRSAPVLVQALTASSPEADERFWWAARRAGAISLVPLLLLPGDHARSDVPAIARHWRQRAAAAMLGNVVVRRRPFLGAWPQWQHLLADLLAERAGDRPLAWLHHPLQGALSARYLSHLAAVLGYPGVATAYSDPQAALAAQPQPPAVLAPLTLAPNRLSESLNMGGCSATAEVLPPLLTLPTVHRFLLAQLEALP
jgi:sirohydrochlorin ferrochelatase